LKADVNSHGHSELPVDIHIDFVFAWVRLWGVRQHSGSWRIETVGKRNGHGRRYVRIARLEVQIPIRKARRDFRLRTVALVLLHAVLIHCVAGHINTFNAVRVPGLHLKFPTHDGDHEGEGLGEGRW